MAERGAGKEDVAHTSFVFGRAHTICPWLGRTVTPGYSPPKETQEGWGGGALFSPLLLELLLLLGLLQQVQPRLVLKPPTEPSIPKTSTHQSAQPKTARVHYV